MRHNLLKSIAAGGVLFFGLTYGQASAQYRDEDTYHHDRDTFYQGREWRMRMFDRIREDLNHVQVSAFAGEDKYKIARAKDQLNELQLKLASGRYDQPELDEVIGSINRVLADNSLSQRDKEILNDDMSRLRDYREHHDSWH